MQDRIDNRIKNSELFDNRQPFLRPGGTLPPRDRPKERFRSDAYPVLFVISAILSLNGTTIGKEYYLCFHKMITPYLFDRNLLLTLNFDGGSAMDWFMYAVSGKLTWVPFYVCILWLVYSRLGLRKLVLFAIVVPLFVTCADQTASLAKEYLPKSRPTHFAPIMEEVHTVNGYVGGPYGTVSSHAANCFGLALLASLLIRRRWFSWMMFGWAAMVSYSRIYLGVHYPMDILFGLFEGLFWAFLWYRVLCWADSRIAILKRLDRHVPYRLMHWRERRIL